MSSTKDNTIKSKSMVKEDTDRDKRNASIELAVPKESGEAPLNAKATVEEEKK